MDIFGCRWFLPLCTASSNKRQCWPQIHKSVTCVTSDAPGRQDVRMSTIPILCPFTWQDAVAPTPCGSYCGPTVHCSSAEKMHKFTFLCVCVGLYISFATDAAPGRWLSPESYKIYIYIYNIALYIVYMYKWWICVDKFILLSTLGQGNLPGAGMRNWVKTWTLSYCRALAGVTTARLTLFYGYKLSIICVMLGLKTC